jgi:hypothetical protein
MVVTTRNMCHFFAAFTWFLRCVIVSSELDDLMLIMSWPVFVLSRCVMLLSMLHDGVFIQWDLLFFTVGV